MSDWFNSVQNPRQAEATVQKRSHNLVPAIAAKSQRKFARATQLFGEGKFADAEPLFEKVIRSEPDNFVALHLLGIIYLQNGQVERAAKLVEKVVRLDPGDPFAHRNLAFALIKQERYEEALAEFDKTLDLKPDFVDAHYNRAVALEELGRPEDALAGYDKAIALDPTHAQAHNNRANMLNALGRHEEALASSSRAIALDASYAEAYVNCGIALDELKRFADALASFDRAILLRPDFAKAHNNRGNVLLHLRRPAEALTNFDHAIALKPDYVEAHSNRAAVLGELNRNEEALQSLETISSLKPDWPYHRGNILHSRMRICDWSDLSGQLAEIFAGVGRGDSVTLPGPLLAACGAPEVQKAAAEIFARKFPRSSDDLPDFISRDGEGKIRLGYFSADFHSHATTDLIAELFERHDRKRFELFAFSFGPDIRDSMRSRVISAFDRFFDVRDRREREIAALGRQLGVDIAVDLKGYTFGGRAAIFGHRVAPIQVAYLGYPGTMSAEFIDYLIADRTLIPDEHRSSYSERIAYLPFSYQANDTKRVISDLAVARAEAGLPEDAFVFCCFNNNYKILPEVFDSWMRILKRVDRSVLWLLQDNETAVRNLRKEAVARGVPAERLIFASRTSQAEHLRRHVLADLFLDTLPCNAHTTASDALWAGLPILTRIGRTFAGRVAASLLSSLELPELISETSEAYEARAIELATNPAMLAEIGHKLGEHRLSKPLFDIGRFTTHIEAAYMAMMERHCAGLAPDDIFVPA